MSKIALRAADGLTTRPLELIHDSDRLMLHLQSEDGESCGAVTVLWGSAGWEVIVQEKNEAAPPVTVKLPDMGEIVIDHDD